MFLISNYLISTVKCLNFLVPEQRRKIIFRRIQMSKRIDVRVKLDGFPSKTPESSPIREKARRYGGNGWVVSCPRKFGKTNVTKRARRMFNESRASLEFEYSKAEFARSAKILRQPVVRPDHNILTIERYARTVTRLFAVCVCI